MFAVETDKLYIPERIDKYAMNTNTHKEEPVQKWLVRCSEGHEFYIDYIPDIVNEITGDFECIECIIGHRESEVKLISEQCVDGECLSCPDEHDMLCTCSCHTDPEYMLKRLEELENETEPNKYSQSQEDDEFYFW